jgi:phenylacetate-coenzyme A ligase PaaK-like adenylate-forming protein
MRFASASPKEITPLERLKRLSDNFRGFVISRRLIAHDRWSKRQLERHQVEAFARLVRYAALRSSFYAQRYAGLDLSGIVDPQRLPPTDKQAIMENFDQVVTDPRLQLADLERHVSQLEGDSYYLGKYRVVGTAGTSGLRGIFVFGREEWSMVMGNALRWANVIGLRPKFTRRLRIASIGADTPMHVTRRLSLSHGNLLFQMLQLKATQPLEVLVEALNAFQPEVLMPYPSVADLLAQEQLEGRLSIRPKLIATHSEVLSSEMSHRMIRAWDTIPFNHYGTTEEPHIASDCSRHLGLHLFEDLCKVEIVDDEYRPVPDGEAGSRFLLTNLYNYTQPLIRYEVTDLIARKTEACPCGRPFSLIADVEGRHEDLMHLPGKEGGFVTVSPMVVSLCVERVEGVKEYEAHHSSAGTRLHVLLVPRDGRTAGAVAESVRRELARELASQGAKVPEITVEIVQIIERSNAKMGKRRLVVQTSG